MKNKIDKICHYSGLPSLATYKSDYIYESELEITVTCIYCRNKFIIVTELTDGPVSRKENCFNCLNQIFIGYEIIDNKVANLKISKPDNSNEQK